MAREVKKAISPDEDPTQRLKRMLEKQGIEWWHDDDVSKDHIEWMTKDAAFTSLGMDGEMLAVKVITKMTPEQAIAATVEQSDKSVRELLDKLIDDLDRLDFEVDHGEMTIGEYEYARDSIVMECARNVETANRVTS